jgi:teichoic acid transport system permease protein
VATVQSNDADTDFEPIYHHYTPHRAGLPPVRSYTRELWHRKPFATELSRATMRGANTSTFFGQAWLVINPLLLAGVYYLLVTIIRGKHDPTLFLHLTATLFAFSIIQSSITSGATSVTGSGKLLINTAFPRLLIPLSAVRTAFFRFLPTIPVYIVLHLALAKLTSWHPMMLGALYFLAMMVIFSMGLAAFFAALQVYFRDTAQFLPYFVRLWMYMAPVLWLPEMLDTFSRQLQLIIMANPLYPLLSGYAMLLQEHRVPPPWMWISSAAWAFGAAAVGFWFFVSREREFAVRIT